MLGLLRKEKLNQSLGSRKRLQLIENCSNGLGSRKKEITRLAAVIERDIRQTVAQLRKARNRNHTVAAVPKLSILSETAGAAIPDR
jgi:lysophospholipase L1-like esterase